jgi:hypothetical protein
LRWSSSRLPCLPVRSSLAHTRPAPADLADACRETGIRFSLGYPLTEPVRQALKSWRNRCGVDQDRQQRDGAWVCELAGQITSQIGLKARGWSAAASGCIWRAALLTPTWAGIGFSALDQDGDDLGAVEALHVKFSEQTGQTRAVLTGTGETLPPPDHRRRECLNPDATSPALRLAPQDQTLLRPTTRTQRERPRAPSSPTTPVTPRAACAPSTTTNSKRSSMS